MKPGLPPTGRWAPPVLAGIKHRERVFPLTEALISLRRGRRNVGAELEEPDNLLLPLPRPPAKQKMGLQTIFHCCVRQLKV